VALANVPQARSQAETVASRANGGKSTTSSKTFRADSESEVAAVKDRAVVVVTDRGVAAAEDP